jgi:hypothetical protein
VAIGHDTYNRLLAERDHYRDALEQIANGAGRDVACKALEAAEGRPIPLTAVVFIEEAREGYLQEIENREERI